MRSGPVRIALWYATCLLACGAGAAHASNESPPRPAAGQLDELLLRGIEEPTAQGPQSPTGQANQQDPPAGGDAPKVKPVAPLSGGEDIQAAPSSAVIQSIEKRMLDVQQRLREEDTSATTQQLQQRIVADLDAVIQQMQQQLANQSSGRHQSDTTQQQSQSSNRDGGDTGDRRSPGTPDQKPGGDGPLAETEAMRQALDRFWGNLPERVRRQVQNMSEVEFLSEYQQLIEDYYRRLAEDRRR
jgi:hypothetical protein